jgi:hypothetical protein
MTTSQLEKAQKLARECVRKKYKGRAVLEDDEPKDDEPEYD